MIRCPNSDYMEEKKYEQKQRVSLIVFNGLDKEMFANKSEKFIVEIFHPILDSLNSDLTKCVEAYRKLVFLQGVFLWCNG